MKNVEERWPKITQLIENNNTKKNAKNDHEDS
jgi:hypothetical protein